MPVCYARPISKAAEAVLAHRVPFAAFAKTLSAIRIDVLQEMMDPLVQYFQHPALQATPKAQAILLKADQTEDALGLDGEGIKGLVVRLKRE